MPAAKPRPVLTKLRKSPAEPGYLLLGNEHYFRDELRKAIVTSVFGDNPPGPDDDAMVEVDLASQPLDALLDEAKALSLFTRERLVLGRNAENALPSGRASKKDPSAEALGKYFANPTPGVTVVLEAPKWDWTDRDDKSKLDRAAKFYSSVPVIVELRKVSAGEAGKAAGSIAKGLALQIDADLLAELADMLACDMTRMRQDLEKLALYVGKDREVTRGDLEALVPEARQSGAYEFSNSLARRDQAAALDVIDQMARAGEYWPLQINLVAALFRQTLAAKEKRAGTPQQVRQALGTLGVNVWPSRAEQIAEIGRRFSHTELERALAELFRADRDLRFPNPDDRLIVERLVLAVTQ